jgi:hypothetical protein
MPAEGRSLSSRPELRVARKTPSCRFVFRGQLHVKHSADP